MSVVLHLQLLAPAAFAPEQSARELAEGVLRIGRDADNDWVLEDEDRLISRHHCAITAKAGLFTVIDTSANGLFLNKAAQPLGRGNSALLSDGDVLHVGRLSIEVRLGAAQADARDAFRALLPPLPSTERLPAGRGPEADLEAEAGLNPPRFRAPPPLPPPAVGPDDAGWRPGSPPLGELSQPERRETVETPADRLPAEEQAFSLPHVVPAAIPSDWDEDLDPAPGTPAPEEAAAAAPPPGRPVPENALLLSLVEALARIERAAFGEAAPSLLLAGNPSEALAQLAEEEGEWADIALADLSARIAAVLQHRGAADTKGGADFAGDGSRAGDVAK